LNPRWIALILVLVISLLAYGDIFNLPFTGTDTFTLIDTSRIQSMDDVLRLFSQPLMSGTAGANRVQYFRPISALSFSIDNALWGMNVRGYYLTNFLLHVVCSLLLFWLVERLSRGDLRLAILSTSIFIIHPVLTQSVSVISHRQDILVAAFCLAALLLVDTARHAVKRKKLWIMALAVLAAVMAMLSKELGFLSPLFIFAYFLFIRSTECDSYIDRIRRAIQGSTPFFAAAGLILIWRTLVVGGVGISVSLSVRGLTADLGEIGNALFMTFVDPGNLIFSQLRRIYAPDPSTALRMISLILVLLADWALISSRSAIFQWIRSSGHWITRALRVFLIGSCCFSLLAVLGYPLLAPLFEDVIGNALQGHGWDFLLGAMEGRERTSLDQYLLRLRDTWIGASYRAAILSLFAIAGIGVAADRTDERSVRRAGIFWMMTLWILFGMLMFVITSRVSWRSLYILVAAFSTAFSILILHGFGVFTGLIHEKPGRDRRIQHLARVSGSVLCIAVPILIVGNLLAYSPIFRDAAVLRNRAEVTQAFFTAFNKQVPQLPQGAELTIVGLPSLDDSYILDYTVKSWLDLHYPGNEMSVTIGDRVAGVECIECMQIEVVNTGDTSFELWVGFPVDGKQ
jgi:hypothetical protein